jgi:hypothetical protein
MGLKGRYIKVLKADMGGETKNYSVGSYLKILEDDTDDSWKQCGYVEYAGTLQFKGNQNRFLTGHIMLMPEGFDPKNIQEFYEIF